MVCLGKPDKDTLNFILSQNVIHQSDLPDEQASTGEDIDESWNMIDDPVDMRKLSTPDTTYCVFTFYDMNHPDNCPVNNVNNMTRFFEGASDHITLLTNRDVTRTATLDALNEAIKHHFAVYYEFSHGGARDITVYSPSGSTADGKILHSEIYDIVTQAQNRMFCMFDSCYVGRVIDFNNFNPDYEKPIMKAVQNPTAKLTQAEPEQDQAETGILEYFKSRLQQKSDSGRALMSATPKQNPMLMLWSATESMHATYYQSERFTYFVEAMAVAQSSNDGSKTYGVIWPEIKKKGTMKGMTEENTMIPLNYQYGGVQDDILAWR